jgi:hypothetical protein
MLAYEWRVQAVPARAAPILRRGTHPMVTFFEFPLLSIFVIVVALMVLFSILSPRRPAPPPLPRPGIGRGNGVPGGAPAAPARTCANCGAQHPGYAAYCRRCGQKIG